MDRLARQKSFGELRSLLGAPADLKRWRRVEALALGWPEDAFVAELWPYLSAALDEADGPREAPQPVRDRVAAGASPAHLLLYTALDLSSRARALTNRVAQALAVSPWSSSLEQLSLARGAVGDEGVAALASSPHLGRLKRLDLCYTCPGPAGLRALGGSTMLGALSALEASWINVTDEGFAELVGGAGLVSLEALVVSHGQLTDAALKALVDSGRLERLRALTLIGHGFTNAGARLIAPHIHNLDQLALDHNDIGRDGLDALLDAPRRRGALISCYPADRSAG